MRNLITLSTDGQLALRASNGTETAIAPRKTLNAILLIDTSGSMAVNSKMRQAKAGAVNFARSAASKGYATGLTIFADRGAVVSDPTTDMNTLSRKIAKVEVGMVGGGNASPMGFEVVGKYTNLSAVVVVTDGYMDNPQDTLAHAERLKRRGIQIICIGTDDADRVFLKALATSADLATHVPSQNIGAAIADASRLLSSPSAPSWLSEIRAL